MQGGQESVKKTPAKPRVGDGTPGPGRPKGMQNKATIKAREAIGLLVEANVPKMAGWLEEIERKDGPLAAWRCLEAMVEFAVPKLIRSEGTLTIKKPEEEASDDELRALLARLKAEQPPKVTT